MNISVISPVHGQTGNTTVALMLAHALALTQRKNICLTHLNFQDSSLARALGEENTGDASTSLTHIVKMLKNDSLNFEELPNYAIKVFPGLDLYTSNQVTVEQQELLSFYESLLANMTAYNHVVIDIDTGIYSTISKSVLGISDVVIIPVTHNTHIFEKAKSLKDEILNSISRARRRREVKIHYLLNHYNPKISSYRQVARHLGVRPSQLLTLHSNFGFVQVCNTGKTSDAFAASLRGKTQFANVRSDLKLACKVILRKEFIWDLKRGGENSNV